MRTHWLALYTFGQFRNRSEHPSTEPFHIAEPGVWRAMERSSGFISRSGYEDEEGPASWGEQVFPKYWQDNGDGWAPSAISLWENLESALAAVYRGPHATILRKGNEFMQESNECPTYVLWWVLSGHQPNWVEAVERFEQLADNGPCSDAFSFKTAFDAKGTSVRLDGEIAKQIAEHNRLRSVTPKAVQ